MLEIQNISHKVSVSMSVSMSVSLSGYGVRYGVDMMGNLKYILISFFAIFHRENDGKFGKVENPENPENVCATFCDILARVWRFAHQDFL